MAKASGLSVDQSSVWKGSPGGAMLAVLVMKFIKQAFLSRYSVFKKNSKNE